MQAIFLLLTLNFFLQTPSKSVYENLLHNHYIPNKFAYLSDIDDTIVQDIRYAKNYNILGQPLDGYNAPECILTVEAAKKLSLVQKEAKEFATYANAFLTLRVFDCYRPKVANEQIFYRLIQKKAHYRKLNFYPNFNEVDIINFGFVELNNPHSRGSTVSVTLSKNILIPLYKGNEEFKIANCIGEYDNRYMFDFGLDMGTNYDCLDEKSFPNATTTYLQQTNRKLLKILMENHGFVSTSKLNWWEFTLKQEPFNETQFNFPISPKFKKEEPGFCYINIPILDLTETFEEIAKKILF